LCAGKALKGGLGSLGGGTVAHNGWDACVGDRVLLLDDGREDDLGPQRGGQVGVDGGIEDGAVGGDALPPGGKRERWGGRRRKSEWVRRKREWEKAEK
jgi:hypothetical protein